MTNTPAINHRSSFERSTSPLSALLRRIRSWPLRLAALALATTTLAAQQPGRAYSEPPVDAPELARLGSHAVGHRVVSFTDEERLDVAAALAGSTATKPRALDVHVWYPAEPSDGGEKAEYEGNLPFSPGRRPPDAPETYRFEGIAVSEAAPVSGSRYPLVIVSHGYGNWAAHLSYLTENLASKGYVVASIAHRDLIADNPAGFALSFGEVVFHRARDQRFVLRALTEFAATDDPLGRVIDSDAVGLVGYSMGGFGAISTAGAQYDMSSPLFQRLTEPLKEGLRASQAPLDSRVKAVVAIAPWGGSLPSRAWSEESLAAINVPLLFIAGDEDDVSGFDGGIDWIFENAVKSSRWMLVYQNARHNIGGNPAPPEAAPYFDLLDWFNEAVWRPERVHAVNQHFVTALMDWRLKGEEDKRSYLDVSPPVAADGGWPNGSRADAAFSGGEHDGQPYWKGFHRRFALGLELRRRLPGAP